MKIQKLNPQVIDQIAAGEVLERPANLIKELVENSLDAGATEIDVDLGRGGRNITIADNGLGIHSSDLPLAVERHATSKIASSEDLWSLNTFGFRGEALASAAAVSRMQIISRTRDEQAAQISIEFGSVGEVFPVSRDIGTTIEIRDLFENVPARLKFLKSDSAELSQIKRVLRAMALIHPEVSFRVRHEGELLLHWPAVSSQKDRVESVLEVNGLYRAQVSGAEGSSEIYFSSPNTVNKTSQNIWIFVNGRWVQDRGLQSAVMEAYRNLLMHGEWPTAVVILEVPPQDLDVNVHPTKSQVKFSDARTAFRLVHGALRRQLETAPWLADVLKKETVTAIVPEESQATFMAPMDLGGTQFRSKEMPRESVERYSRSREAETALAAKPLWSHLQVVGQAGLTYIVAQSSHGIMLVDQHAAHERVAFERLMRSWKESNPEIQDFLIPLSLNLDSSLCEALLSQAKSLEQMGIRLERGGPDLVLVLSAPSLVRDAAVSTVLENVARDVLDQGDSFSFERKLSDIFASMACHSVVRAGQALSREEMLSLLSQMDEFPLSSFCPHGRPVFVEISFRELDEKFGRIV